MNYNHLHYFWVVAREGSIARAAELLHVTPQTISGQLRTLEQQTGAPLFHKAGRNITLTETGRIVLSYAEPMFQLGSELHDVVRDGVARRSVQFKVGVAMVVPKLIVYRILAPALELSDPIQIICHEAPLESLLADLVIHKLDLVLTDSPMSPTSAVRTYDHFLGESGLTFFSGPDAAQHYQRTFPACLDGAPFLFPNSSSALRSGLEGWFRDIGVNPRTVAEFEDAALMSAFGEAGAGLFALPTTIDGDVTRGYRVEPIGRTLEVRERFYAISTERRLKHPSVVAITDAARKRLFS